MVSFKNIINEAFHPETTTSSAPTLRPRDIYNFYYLWHITLHDPQAIQTNFGKEILNHYLQGFKEKYVKLFTKLLRKQLYKYDTRGRVDPDYPRGADLDNMEPMELLKLMKKTFRSDMTRRNERWDLIAEATANLSVSTSTKDIFLWVNQLNNAVHNTRTKVLDKLENYYTELNKAFDAVAKATNIDMLKPMVDKDIKDLKNQESAPEFGAPEEYTESALKEGLARIVFEISDKKS